jgi:hypothetical protein
MILAKYVGIQKWIGCLQRCNDNEDDDNDNRRNL